MTLQCLKLKDRFTEEKRFCFLTRTLALMKQVMRRQESITNKFKQTENITENLSKNAKVFFITHRLRVKCNKQFLLSNVDKNGIHQVNV